MTPAVEAKPAGLCQSEGLSVSVRVIASEGSSFSPSHLLTFVAGIWCSLRAALPASLRLDALLATFKRLKKSNNNKTTVLILSLLIQEMLYNCFFL